MKFKIKWEKRALKELKKIPKKHAKRLVLKIDDLQVEPFQHSFPLRESEYRKIRAGSYRAIIEINFKAHIVGILMIGHRKNIYERFFR